MTLLALAADGNLLPFADVDRIDIRGIEDGIAIIHMKNGRYFVATGFDAIEAVMAVKPSALEGRRLKWKKHAWAFHNLIGHPVMQVLVWLGFKRSAIRFHDYTTPHPRNK